MRNSKNFIRAISIILMIILLIHTTSVASFATDISPNSNIGVVKWPLYSDTTVTDTQASAAANAFIDFIWR